MNVSTQIRMMKRFVPILWSLVAVLGVLDPLAAQQFPPPPAGNPQQVWREGAWGDENCACWFEVEVLYDTNQYPPLDADLSPPVRCLFSCIGVGNSSSYSFVKDAKILLLNGWARTGCDSTVQSAAAREDNLIIQITHMRNGDCSDSVVQVYSNPTARLEIEVLKAPAGGNLNGGTHIESSATEVNLTKGVSIASTLTNVGSSTVQIGGTLGGGNQHMGSISASYSSSVVSYVGDKVAKNFELLPNSIQLDTKMAEQETITALSWASINMWASSECGSDSEVEGKGSDHSLGTIVEMWDNCSYIQLSLDYWGP